MAEVTHPAPVQATTLLDDLGRPSRLRLGLLVVVLIQLALLGMLAKERDVGWAVVKEKLGAVRVWYNVHHDLPVGSSIDPLSLGTVSMTSSRTGVIVLASCEACGLRATTEWARVLQGEKVHHLYVVTRYRPTPRGQTLATQTCRAFGVEPSFLWDRKGRISDRLNAFFLPRCYRFDAGGTLRWAQHWGEAAPALIVPFSGGSSARPKS